MPQTFPFLTVTESHFASHCFPWGGVERVWGFGRGGGRWGVGRRGGGRGRKLGGGWVGGWGEAVPRAPGICNMDGNSCGPPHAILEEGLIKNWCDVTSLVGGGVGGANGRGAGWRGGGGGRGGRGDL